MGCGEVISTGHQLLQYENYVQPYQCWNAEPSDYHSSAFTNRKGPAHIMGFTDQAIWDPLSHIVLVIF